jgi:hypothetical protein
MNKKKHHNRGYYEGMFEIIYQAHRAYTSGFGDKTPEEVIETLSYVFREMALYVNLSIDDIPDYQKDIYNKYMDLYMANYCTYRVL